MDGTISQSFSFELEYLGIPDLGLEIRGLKCSGTVNGLTPEIYADLFRFLLTHPLFKEVILSPPGLQKGLDA